MERSEPQKGFRAPPIPSGCALPRGKIDGVSVLVHRVGIETGRLCNLRCNYCFADGGRAMPGELTTPEILDIIDQAEAVGASIIPIIGGGEPTLNHDLVQIVASIAGKGLLPGVFTNGLLMTMELARTLFDLGAYVVGKLNSLDDDLEDSIVGVRGASRRIKGGIETLIEAGFAAVVPSRLSLHTIITRQNYSEIPTIFRWERDRNIVPYIQLPVLTGRAREELTVSDERAKDLFYSLREIDRNEYGYDWMPMPPNVAWSCTQRLTSCYITSTGDVQMCSGTNIPLGNVRQQRLRDILMSPALREMRDLSRIHGNCAVCPDLGIDCCAGCTGNTFNTTGDITASDERCWHRYQA